MNTLLSFFMCSFCEMIAIKSGYDKIESRKEQYNYEDIHQKTICIDNHRTIDFHAGGLLVYQQFFFGKIL